MKVRYDCSLLIRSDFIFVVKPCAKFSWRKYISEMGCFGFSMEAGYNCNTASNQCRRKTYGLFFFQNDRYCNLPQYRPFLLNHPVYGYYITVVNVLKIDSKSKSFCKKLSLCGLRSSGMLRSLFWHLHADISRQSIGDFFKVQAVQDE